MSSSHECITSLTLERPSTSLDADTSY